MDCFKLGPETITNLEERFQLSLTEDELLKFTAELVSESVDNWRTGAYDNFQKYSNGIL
jgi:phosphatidylinositol 4-kinase